MTESDLIAYCKNKPGATEEHPYGDRVSVYKIGSKMFVMITKRDHTLNLNLKCDPELALTYRAQFPAVTEGYHMNKKHWNNIAIDGSMSPTDIQKMIDYSYDLVFSKLKKTEREYIILNFENALD